MSFVIHQFEIGPMQNFAYLIGDVESKKAFVVDPAWDPDLILKMVKSKGYSLAGFLISHSHYDHTNAIEDLLNQVDVPVYAHKAELEIAQSGNQIFGSLGRTAKGVEGGEVLQLGNTPVEILHTPGHTPGSQCIKVGDNLITGDTLFVGGCGRSDLPGGDAATLFKSLKKIAGLSSQTQIWPGHDYGIVPKRELGEEIKENPYLHLDNAELFVQKVSY